MACFAPALFPLPPSENKEQKRQIQEPEQKQPPVLGTKRAPRSGPKLRELQQARREERLARSEQVIALQQQGMSQTALARQVTISQQTVHRCLAADPFPEKKPRKQASHIDRSLPYRFARWEAGCQNIARLFRELVELGSQGSYASVRDLLLRFAPNGRKPQIESSSAGGPPVLPREALFLFLRRPKDLEPEEQKPLALLRHLHPDGELAYDLVQPFAHRLRTRTGERLDTWLEKVRASTIRGFQSFVLGIERGYCGGTSGPEATGKQRNG